MRRALSAFCVHFLLTLFLVVTATAAPQRRRAPAPSFTGDWNMEAGGSMFHLSLTQKGSSITGSHSIVIHNGAKIDTSEVEDTNRTSIRGKATGKGVALVGFQSGRDNAAHGKARLRLAGNRLMWETTAPAHGDHLFPEKITLTRRRSGEKGK